jgi:hypothetical protein
MHNTKPPRRQQAGIVALEDTMQESTAIRRRALLAAALVCIYFFGSYLLIVLGTGGRFTFYATMPAQLLVIGWNPVLRPLGLTEGSWLVAPTVPACIAIVLLYAALAYWAVRALGRKRRRGVGSEV